MRPAAAMSPLKAAQTEAAVGEAAQVPRIGKLIQPPLLLPPPSNGAHCCIVEGPVRGSQEPSQGSAPAADLVDQAAHVQIREAVPAEQLLGLHVPDVGVLVAAPLLLWPAQVQDLRWRRVVMRPSLQGLTLCAPASAPDRLGVCHQGKARPGRSV